MNSLHKKEGKGKQNFPPYEYCGKKGYPFYKCWKRSNVKCYKLKQLGHIAKICKSKPYQIPEA